MARSRPFLSGTILFSSISPNYEANLKNELFGCFKYIGIPFSELYRMPTKDRKFYIRRHNDGIEAAMERKNDGNRYGGDITHFTDLEQNDVMRKMGRNL